MEEVSCKKTLETQKALPQCAWIKEFSPKRIESKEVKRNGGKDWAKFGETQLTFLGQERLPAPIKGGNSYSAKQPSRARPSNRLAAGKSTQATHSFIPISSFLPSSNLPKFPSALALNLCLP
ncbi:hypothetical protein L3X38_041960 [Prunus dulcis]|uniref:Uncharacterized protein n=1 Tax=Prunus dulcis TaxID=3755 RepID=A0AAD4YKS2_PRUDU|nr:hypothetical protein L3X38_041960 [Prunus dulcis]